jgi:3-methyladenine DNA glycosylase AlkD
MEDERMILEKLPEVPDPVQILEVIEEVFSLLGEDPEYRQGMQMAVPGASRLYGVKVPQLRKLSKEILKKYRKDKEPIQRIAEACWLERSREHELVALFLWAGIPLAPVERWEIGVRCLPDVGNWESCDQLCMALLGQALAEDPQYIEVLETWVKHENFWVRRAALVAPVYLRRANYPSEVAKDLDQRTLGMAARLLDDPEKYIRKAVDWTVREVIKRQYDMGFEWLKMQAQSDPSKIAKSTLRLASKKLTRDDQRILLTLLEQDRT